MVSIEQNNEITERDINTRKELWDSLFLFVDFSRMKEEYPNMWSKEYKLLPLPKPYQETKQKFTNYCQELNGRVENLINSYAPYFQQNIYPALESSEGDKTLLFRAKRLLNNKVIGESSSLFIDLAIWEVEWRQQQQFKELLRQLQIEPCFLTDREDELMANDLEKLIDGRINYSVAGRWYWKWASLMTQKGLQQELWKEIGEYLKKWQHGKAAPSQWPASLKRMEEARERLFDLGSESINDGKPFLQLGFIKGDTNEGLRIVGQNRKGFNLNNPFLRVVNFHQKVFRVYTVKGHVMNDPRRLYVSLQLEEDWVWKDYPWVVNSMGSLVSGNHPVYGGRNLLTDDNDPRILKEKHRLCFPFCSDLGNKEFCWPNQDLDSPTNPTNLDNQINIKWALFRLRQAPDIFGGPVEIKDTEILIPGAYYVEKVKPDDWTNLLMKSEKYDVFVAPSDYYDNKCLFKTWRKQLIIDLPSETKELPHLFKHTAFQFCFLRDIIFSTNLLYMDIDKDNKIRATIDIYASPAGTYFIFKSGEIPFKWKLDVRQGIITWNLITDTIEGIQKTMQGIGKAILPIAGGFSGWSGWGNSRRCCFVSDWQ